MTSYDGRLATVYW